MEITLSQAINKIAKSSAVLYIDRKSKGWFDAHGHNLQEDSAILALLFDEDKASVYKKLKSKEQALIREMTSS